MDVDKSVGEEAAGRIEPGIMPKRMQVLKTVLKKSAYSLTVGDISLRIEGYQALSKLRKIALADIFYTLQEVVKLRALAETYIDEDEEELEEVKHGIKTKKLRMRPKFEFDMSYA